MHGPNSLLSRALSDRSCHFRYFEALLDTSLTNVSNAIASTRQNTFDFKSLLWLREMKSKRVLMLCYGLVQMKKSHADT